MGTSCVCPVTQPPLTPRLQGKQNQVQPPHSPKDIKFADINPVEVSEFQRSEMELRLLNQQIVGYLNQFQNDNGIISRRFTFQPQAYSQRNSCNFSFNSKNRSLKLLENHDITQVVNHPRNSQQECNDFSESFYSEADPGIKQKSCLLSQQSHILESSLFSDRVQVKNNFYQKYCKMQNFHLQDWHQKYRYSFKIFDQQMKMLTRHSFCSQKLLVLLHAIQNYYSTHQLHLLAYSQNPIGFKVHFNGRKRLLPLQQCQGQPSLDLIMQLLTQMVGQYQIGEIVYYLTGWISEEMRMSEIRSFQGIFQRLNNNLEEGNILAFFSRQQNTIIQYATLTNMDLQNGTITVNICSCQSTIPQQLFIGGLNSEGQFTMKIQDFIIIFDSIHLSWNPIIYETTISRQCILINQLSMSKYKLVIPPSSQDIQIRVFCEKHHNCSQNEINPSSILIKLFQYENMGNIADSAPVRVVQVDRNVLSDVFIFESCKEKTEYLLTIQTESTKGQEIYSTITLFSFVQIYFNQAYIHPLLAETVLKTQMTPKNKGYGINSPYFSQNLQFSIQTQSNKQLQISIIVDPSLFYQICLIPNPDKRQSLTKLNLQTIINNSILSNQKHGSESFTISTACQNYILVINSYSEYQGDITINLSLCGKKHDQDKHMLELKQIKVNNKIIFIQGVKWFPTNHGPRKRLKSNSNHNYQSAEVFADFFKNPVIDYQITKGKYQFFLKSESFQEYFDQVQEIQKNECQPPALSMSVLKISENRQEYQIVIDDAFYIPLGFGFWTNEIELEDGQYRFVLPKMDKTFAKGSFGIIQC